MNDCVFQFLNQHCDWSRPVLLGLSGGPDSMALLHLLLECSQKKSFKLGVAHIDHGWREESAQEAAHLEGYVRKLGFPFHLKTLDPRTLKGNLEDACRKNRYAFFSELANQHNYQAVILGHHQDDQSETILKRILEGSALINLKGIQAKSTFSNLPIWRPLLNIPKSSILEWLSKKNYVFFEDRTNDDPRFLRGRMRSSLFPFLNKEFGKEIRSSLIHIGNEAGELENFLKQHLNVYLNRVETTPIGFFLDLSTERPNTSFEIKQLLRYFFDQCDRPLSRSQIENAVDLILEKKGNKRLEHSQRNVYFDRGRVFVEKKPLPDCTFQNLLETENTNYHQWKITYTPCTFTEGACTDWRDILRGSFYACLPYEKYKLAPPMPNALYPNSSNLDKWWTKHKVPAFLRTKIPVILRDNHIVHEFLTGKMNPVHDKIKKWAKITFEYNA